MPIDLHSFLNIDVEAVEAARIRMRDVINNAGEAYFEPDWEKCCVPGYPTTMWWEIEMVNTERICTINELLEDLFPEGKGFIPAAAGDEVAELLMSSQQGPDEFLAHVERARTFLEWRGHKKLLPLKRSSCTYKRQDYDVMVVTMQAIASALEKHWIAEQSVTIAEERCGVYSIRLCWCAKADILDITEYFPPEYLTDDGYYAANSRSEVIRMLLASLLDEDQFFNRVELSAVSLALLEGMNEDRAD